MDLIENLQEEQLNLDKKIYILKVINLAVTMTELIQSEMSTEGIWGISLDYHQGGYNY